MLVDDELKSLRDVIHSGCVTEEQCSNLCDLATFLNEESRLIELLYRFLEERRESPDGGWAPITEGDKEGMIDVLEAIIDAKWGADADGDYPVSYRLSDRTKYHTLSEIGILHSPKTRGDYMLNLQSATANTRAAADVLRTAAWELDEYLKEEEGE